MNAISHPLPETAAQRRDRQLGYFRRAAEHTARAMDIASEQLEAAYASGEPGATTAPSHDLARATRALILVVNAENRVVAGQPTQRVPASDTRRPLLREALHKAADVEPNPKIRSALHREIEIRIDEALLADPNAEIELCNHLGTIADELDLDIDITKISDEILGMPPRHIYPEPGSPQALAEAEAQALANKDTGDP